MANSKISALTSATTPLAGTETLPIVQSSATKQVSVANLTAGRSVSGTSFVPTGSTIPANGLYLPAANSVGLATNTTNAFYVDSSQNVGIGTSSPSAKLTIGDGSSPSKIQVNSSSWADIVLKGPNTNGGSIYWNNGTTDKGEIFYYHAADYMAFKTNATEQWRIDLAGNFVQKVASKGVNFTANTPAAGVTSQLLNWYEEGTWTPNIGGTATYTSQIGRYTRIGRLVTFMGDLTINVQGTGNAGVISGLPFSAAANNAVYVGYFSGLGALVSSISPFVGGTSINLYGVTTPSSTASGLNLMTSGARLMFQGSYEV
jgi:hypothetical protein